MKRSKRITEQTIVHICFSVLLGVWLYMLFFGQAQIVELTDDTEKRYQGSVEIGYVVIDENGNSTITTDGEIYIERQKRIFSNK